MGTGASVQSGNPQQQQGKQNGSRKESGKEKNDSQDKKVKVVTTYASVNPESKVSRMIKKPEWKLALKNRDFLAHILHRKMRATALGRKSACRVKIRKTGFSVQRIILCEGQVVTFSWNDEDGRGFNVIQVVHDGEKHRVVVGGFHSGPVTKKGLYEQQFNMAGEYKFTSAGIKTEPLVVEVHPRKDVESVLTNEGFEPNLIRLDEGNALKWTWNDCDVPQKITEVTFNLKEQSLTPVAPDKAIGSKSGSYRKEFSKPGLYYFQNGGSSPKDRKTCIVHVRERQREYKISVENNASKPQILVIEEGDRVWWEWSSADVPVCLNCSYESKVLHSVYEVELSTKGSNSEKFKPMKNGFKWQSPSKNGLMSQEFFKAGVYYYSDESAEHLGTIIVKPAAADYFIELTKDGFVPDMSHVKTGDRIWWTWLTNDFDQGSVVQEIEKCISSEGQTPPKIQPGTAVPIGEELMGQKFEAGLELSQPSAVGVYHYYNHDTDSVCSLVCNAGPKNHTIHVSDNGFDPPRVTVGQGDRVWWIWQEGSKKQNIVQASHKGRPLSDGFNSGPPVLAPSAFMHQFNEPGLYYYASNGVGKSPGIVWVKPQPQVHEIEIQPTVIEPDPKVIRLNDVVAWNFDDLVENDVTEVKTIDDVKTAESNSIPIIHRGCLNRVFPNKGIFHFAGKAFSNSGKGGVHVDGHRVSTIIVDGVGDGAPVHVDDKGFHPMEISVPKGKSVCWNWKNSDVPHNIVNVKRPLNATLPNTGPLVEIQGDGAFSSGQPVLHGSYLHTFNEPGVYYVASEGAPSRPGIVTVTSDEGVKTADPWIVSEKNGGVVARSHVVKLACDDPRASLYYTTDGSEPCLNSSATHPYNPEKGIKLGRPGFQFVRAIAVAPSLPNSNVLTSKRFWVLDGKDEKEDDKDPEEETGLALEKSTHSGQLTARSGEPTQEDIPPVIDSKDIAMWEKFVPEIKASFAQPGMMKVTWNAPSKDIQKHVKGYQLFLNGVSYSKLLDPKNNRATVTGLAGGRTYNIQLVAYPGSKSLRPRKSKALTLTSPKTVESDGPLISLERTAKPDAMSIVWMSLNSKANPIEGYRIYLNGHMCGNMIVPDTKSNRCRVVIEGCNTNVPYKVKVAAIAPGGSPPKMSNELSVTLPLNVENVQLPEDSGEKMEEDGEEGKYSEFVVIKEDPAHEEREKEAERKAKSGNIDVEVDDDEIRDGPTTPPSGEKDTSTAIMTVAPVSDSDGHLPVPIVTTEKLSEDSICVSWKYSSDVNTNYRLIVNAVNVVGQKFRKSVNSDYSFECMHDDYGNAVPAIQHIWNVSKGDSCIVKGLARGSIYSVNVVTNYALANSKHSYEIQTKSRPVSYSTSATAQPSAIKVLSLDPNKVTFSWENDDPNLDPDPDVIGYQLMIDGQPVGDVMSRSTHQMTLDKLTPGKTIKATIAPVTMHGISSSEISCPLKVSCPRKPPQPVIKEQPSYKRGTAMIAWENPLASVATAHGDDVVFYRIFLDGKLHGEMKANAASNRNGYQYYLTDLTPGQTYDVSIKAFAGQSKLNPNSDQVFCLAESNASNSIPVMCPAPPDSPQLRVDGMNSNGLEVSWEMPQQYGDATVSGYQMLKDGKLYGSIIPPDVQNLKIKNLKVGEKVDLQILALTDHAVGRDVDGDRDDSDPHSDKNDPQGPTEIFIGDQYSACKPGPKLVVHYTDLVEAPSKVWCEQVTGHSAMIVWSKDEKPKQHFVSPDNYQVTWWPGEKAEDNIQSQSTKDDHMLITGLQPNTPYTFAVEARKIKKYSEISEGYESSDDGSSNTFIMAAQSDHLHLRTASPPSPPSNVGVLSTTCNSVQVAWDSPDDRGSEIVAMRVDAIDMNSEDKKIHSTVELPPDATSASLENLQEKTDYLIAITAVTSEFLEQGDATPNDKKRRHALPKDRPVPDDSWLPTASVIVKTSGTEAPTDIHMVKTTPDSVTLEWEPAKVFGSNRLQGTVVRWMEFKPGQSANGSDTVLAYHRTVQADANRVTIDGLEAGVLYRFIVEAVVSLKTTLDVGKSTDAETERTNRRTTHVLSKPVVARTRAPCEPPKPIITGYTTSTVNLYWEKPLMHLLTGKDMDGNPKHLKLSLQGYRLEINGKPHMRLSPDAQSCTLVKCKPGRTYKIVLVAITCTAEAHRIRKKQRKISTGSSGQSSTMSQEWKSLPEDAENDESPSEIVLATLPVLGDGYIGEKNAKYVMPEGKTDGETSREDLGNILVQWLPQGNTSDVRQYNVTWRNLVDGTIQHKCLDPDIGKFNVPVTKRKAIYDIVVEPKFNKDTVPSNVQHVQVLVPGPPDSPEVWTKSVDDKEFVVEWSEPRLYGTKVDGYQVFVNGKKVGNPLSSQHRKAVIPCKPNRQYKINLVALSSDQRISDSDESTTLMVNTGPDAVPSIDYAPDMDEANDMMTMGDENELILRVIRVEDSAIHLDWTGYQESTQNLYYRVVWSSSAQPAEREVRLPVGEKGCVLHKCYPGTNHYVRLYAVGAGDVIIDKSRQLTIQTSAPPEPPTVCSRAVNFNYLAIQWEKSTVYGDAVITGYKIYVNGIVETVLGPEQFTYSFTHGQWCHEYVFQVQAVTNVDQLSSRLSDPLVLVWPGVLPPVLQQTPPTTANTVKVVWEAPFVTEGVKIKQLKLIVLEEETERLIQNISPIHPAKEEVEIHNLKQGDYIVYMEVHIHGTAEIIKSDTVKVSPVATPNPPEITVQVMGLEERRVMEKKAYDLFNMRDRLLNVLNNKDVDSASSNTNDEQTIARSTYRLSVIEELLDDCLATMAQHFTGQFLVQISWTCVQNDSNLQISGFKLLVDGKQYGATLRANVKTIRIKLGTGHRIHRISLICMNEQPLATSAQSNVVEVVTDPFQPFTAFSFLSQSPKNGIPRENCMETLSIERKFMSKRPVNQGLMRRRTVSAPSCNVMDVLKGEVRPLLPNTERQDPTAILFWSTWCGYSQKFLTWFVRFAKAHHSELGCIAVACETSQISAADRQKLARFISDLGCHDDTCLRHVANHTVTSNSAKSTAVSSSDLCELIGIIGLPSIVFVHPENYIAWRGRYYANSYESFEHFMRYMLAQVMGHNSLPSPDPWEPEFDLESSYTSKKRLTNREAISNNQSSTHSGAPWPAGLHQRPLSAKQNTISSAKKPKKEEITAKIRPFSASRSPYEEKLARSGSQNRNRKAKSNF